MPTKRVAIVGGGLAGLVTSIHLASRGISCLLLESRAYPFHRVCGEYVSNEVVPYLTSLKAYPFHLSPSQIKRFQLTSVNGLSAQLPLDLGGFGISRYAFDHFLYVRAKEVGVDCNTDTEVSSIVFDNGQFSLHSNRGSWNADLVIGTFGKRSKLDKHLNRSFMGHRSPYVGVKYHVRLNGFPDDLIALHNFQHGYCGISRIENGITNLCYLTHRQNVKAHGSLQSMEAAVLFKNPHLRKIFGGAEFLFERPETINEITFESKSPVDGHILMAGDAAGMITPLCGNGMAMAIHSAKVVSEHVIRFCHDKSYSQSQLEWDYTRAWNRRFSTRLWAGRQIQRLFGSAWTSNLAVGLAHNIKPVANYLMKKTHGDPF